MKTYIQITKYDHLRTPKYKWTICNDVGGTFSNSGEYRSLRALGKAFRAQYPDPNWLSCPIHFVTYFGTDGTGKAIETSYDTYFAKLFGTGG